MGPEPIIDVQRNEVMSKKKPMPKKKPMDGGYKKGGKVKGC